MRSLKAAAANQPPVSASTPCRRHCSGRGLFAAVVLAAATSATGNWPCKVGQPAESCPPRWLTDRYYPKFHVRPPAGGHNNDPAFPFRDPATGFWHLSMDYCGGESSLDNKPGSEFHCAYNISGKTYPGALQTLAHFASRDLVTWQYLPPMVSPTAPPGSVAPPGDTCPDSGGLGTGSATIVDGNPRLLFPAIHSCDNGVRCFSQCIAEPANRSDPLLREWGKRMIIDDHWPAGIDVNRHDDSSAFQLRGRWWMFLATGSTDARPNHGVNLLYSSADFQDW